jgi:uncharacterized SAM-binding protein YcdF (DUF218 family)/lysophospholipase L1-like esterase
LDNKAQTPKVTVGPGGVQGRGTGRRRFVIGVLIGVVLVFAVRFAINETTVADALIAPLLTDDSGGTADAIVVMGAGVIGQCSPNLNGVWRVLRGAREWRAGRAPLIAFTGGQGNAGCPISVAMARLAREVGVPADRIVLETRASSTRENAVLTAPLLRGRGVHCVLVVTDRLHMQRAAATFTSQGFAVARASVPIYEGHRDNVSMLAEGAREGLALAYYRMRGWLGPPDRPCPPARAAAGAPDGMQNVTPVNLTYPAGPLVVFGASYAGGWKPERLAGVPVINRGVGGETSGQMRERFEREMLETKPRAVIIWGFINDVFRAPAQADAALNAIRDNYTAMIDTARRLGIEPIVATEVTARARDGGWRDSAAAWLGWLRGKEGYIDRVNRQVMDTNRWLLDLARRQDMLLLDLQGALADADGGRRREFVQEDGSHITTAGYEAATAYAAPILDGHFGRHSR